MLTITIMYISNHLSQRGGSIEEIRRIRAQQDWEYEESLRIDRVKEAQARNDTQRAQVICLFCSLVTLSF